MIDPRSPRKIAVLKVFGRKAICRLRLTHARLIQRKQARQAG